MRKISILKAGAAPVALGLVLAATPAFAQDQDMSEEAAPAEEARAIVVTGSRIARPNLESASPVTVVSAEQIELTGTTTLETLLNQLPQVIPGNTRVSNNAGGENFATLDLRGLGPARTLILVDGERLPASTTTGVIDINQIPVGLIQRVEVVTGGASAVYGSDAIGGVINFILKEDYEGVEFVGLQNFSEDGAFQTYTINGTMGGNFADGRGNFTFFGSWTDRDGVFQGRYPYSRVSGALYFDPNVDVGVGGPIRVVDDPSKIPPGYIVAAGGGSATPPWGWIANSAANPFQNLGTLLPNQFGAGTYDTNCDGVANTTPYNTGNLAFDDQGRLIPRAVAGNCAIPLRSIGSNRYNFGPVNYLITPFDRLTLTAVGRYEFSDKTRLKLFSSYTNANQQVALAPTPATNIVVPANSPLIPADLAIALASRPNPNAPFIINRRFSETGPRIGDFSTDSKNIRLILEHDFDDKWSANLVGSFGRVDNRIQNQGNIRRSAVTQGLNGCPTGSGPGCVPIDIFGPNTLTPAMLSFVALTTTDTESFEQLRFATNLTGSLFELPGGPLGIAVGAEYRKDTGKTQVDDAKRTGDIIGFNAQGSISGQIEVKEVYGEIRAPILDFFSVGAGARYSDYSTIGGLFNWKAEAELNPVSWARIRASYNKAARAPNVFELFQNGDQGFPSYVDPCNDTAARTPAILAVCQATAPGFNFTGFQQVNSQVQAFAFGDPTLKEEKAETWTAGIVLTPPPVAGVRLTFTADYYDIELTNRVAGLGAGFYISQCYQSNVPSACQRIVRSSVTGQIESVATGRTNSPTPLITRGVDVGLDASFDAFGGVVFINDVLTYVDTFRIGTSEFVDTVFSGIGGVTPEWSNTLTVGWRNEKFTGQVRYVWDKGGRQNFPGAELEGFFPDSGRIPDLNLVNLSLRWQASDNIEITGIVKNLLDKYPPQTPTGYFEQANTNINFYDDYAVGRNFTIQARVKF